MGRATNGEKLTWLFLKQMMGIHLGYLEMLKALSEMYLHRVIYPVLILTPKTGEMNHPLGESTSLR